MKFILGEKREMTQKFSEDGNVIPVTKIIVGPCVITQVKSEENDGYTAVQFGYGFKKKLNKSILGHLKNLGNFRFLREFRIKSQDSDLKVGDKITAGVFAAGDIVKVSGISKGKGFQGVVKRHGFHGSPKTHGHKDQLRHSGSIGAGGVQHVFKGVRMGGRMGGENVTVTNLKIMEVNPEAQEIFIKGAIPGAIGGLVLISNEGKMNLVAPVVEAKVEVKDEIKNEEIKTENVASEVKPEETKLENNSAVIEEIKN